MGTFLNRKAIHEIDLPLDIASINTLAKGATGQRSDTKLEYRILTRVRRRERRRCQWHGAPKTVQINVAVRVYSAEVESQVVCHCRGNGPGRADGCRLRRYARPRKLA